MNSYKARVTSLLQAGVQERLIILAPPISVATKCFLKIVESPLMVIIIQTVSNSSQKDLTFTWSLVW